jgi:Rab guanine nucleotide exchange factor SEC2
MATATKLLSHSASTPQLSKVSMVTSPALSPRTLFRHDSDLLNTIPDPRAPSPASNYSRNGSTDSGHHPDLSDEVAQLSAKLVTAINHQTNLDDNLQHTQHELESAREHITRLEAAAKVHEEQLGTMVKKDEAEATEARLRRELAEEKKQRIFMEKEKKRIEGELESLTSALFEEANTMVAAARKETEACERRNEQLKQQLADTDILLASQQEQLQDLKAVVEKISSERDENDSAANNSTAPSTPGPNSAEKMSKIFEAANLSPYVGNSDEITPEHPLRFSHLIHPVLRDDLTAFREFKDLLKTAKSVSSPPSRVGSGNYGSLKVLGFGGSKDSSTPNSAVTQQSNGSSTSLPFSNAATHHSPVGSTSPRLSDLPPLKENVFYKRALAEDIEPTLRLDQAPGISWMARRNVINCMTTGSFTVEPHPPVKKFRGPVYACAMCGENRVGEQYARRYRFRLSENEDAQRYPLCDYCLGRVRSACDYISFIRMVRDGHWRAETDEEIKAAWEESVRLRERMFWAKIGGGVVPAFLPLRDSEISPTKDVERKSEESRADSIVKPDSPKKEDPFRSETNEKRVSIGSTQLEPISKRTTFSNDIGKNEDFLNVTIGEDVSPLTPTSARNTSSLTKMVTDTNEKATVEVAEVSDSLTPVKPKEKDSKLEITIPGSFD